MKNAKKVISLLLIALIVCASTVTAFASVTMDGYSYNLTNTDSASLIGWDNSSNVLTVPDAIGRYYVTDIANSAFYQDDFIKTLDLSSAYHLKKIGMFAFYQSVLEETVSIPSRVTEVGISAFDGCSKITGVHFSAGNGTVPAQCFRNCTSLENVTITDYISKIDRNAFANCTPLEYMEIPKSVTAINATAFDGDENLVMGVYKDSYALQYAEENQIDHIILDGDKIGDVNGDGVVDILDATDIQKYAAESREFTPEQFELGDINDDGYCDVIDALLVQKSVIGAYEMPQNIIRY